MLDKTSAQAAMPSAMPLHNKFSTQPSFKKENVMKKLVLIACAAVVFLAGCNTVKGAGQDISRGGQAVSKTATEVQQNM